MVLLESIFFIEIINLSGLPRVFLGLCEFVPMCMRICTDNLQAHFVLKYIKPTQIEL